MIIGYKLLIAPAPGETKTFGAFTVTSRVSKCGPDEVPRYFVHNGYGEMVAMGISFRRLAHYRRWQLDPATALRKTKEGETVILDEPDGWPVEQMNDWQRRCWEEALDDMRLGDVPDPITREYRPRGATPKGGERVIAQKLEPEPEPPPPPAPVLPTLARGAANDEGQFSLWQ